MKQLETKSGIWFLDVRNGAAPKALPGWKSPEGLMEELQHDIEEAQRELERTDYSILADKSGLNLRYYQIEAIKAVEKAIADGKERRCFPWPPEQVKQELFWVWYIDS